MDVGSYLDRLEIPRGLPPTLADLCERHQMAVPFENLDIHAGRPMRLDEGFLLDKIVRRGRGGFCYELNGAFAWLLRALGHDVTLLAAEVAKKDGAFGIPFDHMALRVDLDLPWLVDVGFGRTFHGPVPLGGGEIRILGHRYRVRREGAWHLAERDGAPQYRFTLEPRTLADFAPGFIHHTTSPESSFTRGRVAARAHASGWTALTETLLIETGTKGARTETPVAPEDWERVLYERLGLTP